MKRRPVTSSNVSSVGWEEEGEDSGVGTLEVEYRSGHIYRYEGVAAGEYSALLGASSPGKHMNARIVGRYQQQRLA